MTKNLDKMFAKIEKNSKSMAIKAMDNVMQKAYKLSIKKAKSCLQEYYKWKPKYYKRTKSLLKAIKVVAPKRKDSGKLHEIRFAIIYDSSFLDGSYTSNSWYHQSGNEWKSVAQYQTFDQSNGVPDSGWILENYLYGIHPRYVGTPEIGVVNKSIQDDTITMTEMTKFFQTELPDMIGDMINEEMQDAIFKFLQG